MSSNKWSKLENTSTEWLEETGLFDFTFPYVGWLATADATCVEKAVEEWVAHEVERGFSRRSLAHAMRADEVFAMKKVVRDDARCRLSRVLRKTLWVVAGLPGSLSLLEWVHTAGLFALDAPSLAVDTFKEYTSREMGPWDEGVDFAGIPQLLVALPDVRAFLDTPSEELRRFAQELLRNSLTTAVANFVQYVCPLALTHMTLDDLAFAVNRSHARDLPVWLAHALPAGVFDPARDGDTLLATTCERFTARDGAEVVLRLTSSVTEDVVQEVFLRAVQNHAMVSAFALCETRKLSPATLAHAFRIACEEQHCAIAQWIGQLHEVAWTPGDNHPLVFAMRGKKKRLSLDMLEWLMDKPGASESVTATVFAECSFLFDTYEPERTSMVVFRLISMLGLSLEELGVTLLPRLLTLPFPNWAAQPWLDFFMGLLAVADDVSIEHATAEIAAAAQTLSSLSVFDTLLVELGNKSLVGWSDFAVAKYACLRRFPAHGFRK